VKDKNLCKLEALVNKYTFDIDSQDIRQNTLFHDFVGFALGNIEDRAERGRYFQMIDLLITKKANPVLLNRHGQTPLQLVEEYELDHPSAEQGPKEFCARLRQMLQEAATEWRETQMLQNAVTEWRAAHPDTN
jgi:hypothetical protein